MAYMPRPQTPTTVEVNGYALREIRIARGINIQLLAQQIKRDRSYVAKIELGHSIRVSPETFHAVVAALGVDFRSLLANPHAAGVLEDVS